MIVLFAHVDIEVVYECRAFKIKPGTTEVQPLPAMPVKSPVPPVTTRFAAGKLVKSNNASAVMRPVMSPSLRLK